MRIYEVSIPTTSGAAVFNYTIPESLRGLIEIAQVAISYTADATVATRLPTLAVLSRTSLQFVAANAVDSLGITALVNALVTWLPNQGVAYNAAAVYSVPCLRIVTRGDSLRVSSSSGQVGDTFSGLIRYTQDMSLEVDS